MDYPSLSAEELIAVCQESRDSGAWEEFVRRFNPLISGMVVRICRRWSDDAVQHAEDIIQDVYLKLCADDFRVLRSFNSIRPDSIYGFIKVFAANCSQDTLKAMQAKKRGGSTRTESLDGSARERSGFLQDTTRADIEKRLLLRQVEQSLRSATSGPNGPRDRRIFWLYYRVGLSASGIAMLPSIGLSLKGVESTLLRVTRSVREKLEAPSTAPNAQEALKAKQGSNRSNLE